RISAVKIVDQIFEQTNLVSAVLESAGKNAFVIKPAADLAREMPLTDHEQYKKNEYRADRGNNTVDRYAPGFVYLKRPHKNERTDDKKNARCKTVEKIFGRNGRK